MLTSAKLRRSWYYQIYFLKLHMCVYLHTKFEVSSLILRSFRRGNFIPPPEKEHLKSPPRLGLKDIFLLTLKCYSIYLSLNLFRVILFFCTIEICAPENIPVKKMLVCSVPPEAFFLGGGIAVESFPVPLMKFGKRILS